MKKYLIVLCIVTCLLASTGTDHAAYRDFQYARHDINNLTMVISNFGTFGQGETGISGGLWWHYSGYEPDRTYIYGAGIWFGTIDSLTGDTLVSTGYDLDNGYSEFAPGLQGMSVDDPAAVIYAYLHNWPPPESIFPMAPQEAVSDQDSWCCFNDCDSSYHAPGDTRPIGIEVYQTGYTWDQSEAVDIIFLVYEVKNISGHVLRDCHIGIATHCQISWFHVNDRCCAIIERQYVIDADTFVVDNLAYQWQEEAEEGWPVFPGTVGFDLLQTPFDLVPGQDKDGDTIPDQFERDSVYYVINWPAYKWDVDLDGVPDWRDPSQWPQLGMTAFKRRSPLFLPNSDSHRFLTMAGFDFLTGQYEPYDTILPDPLDKWGLFKFSGPFDLEPDSVVTLVFAIMVTAWSDDAPGSPPGYPTYETPDSALALVDKWAQRFYDMYWFLHTGIEENHGFRVSNCKMNIMPNPVTRTATVSFSLSAKNHVSLKLYNIVGQLVRTLLDDQADAGRHALSLNVNDLPGGTYFLVLETSTQRTSRAFVIMH